MVASDLNFSPCFNNDNFIIIEKSLLKGIIDFFLIDSNLIIRKFSNI